MRIRRTAALVLLVFLVGCSSKQPATREQETATEHAPQTYRVRFETSKGPFTVEVTSAWAPLGADRFYELVHKKFFDGSRFFRVIRKFVVQFGINGDPSVSQLWSQMRIVDDPVKESNRRGTITFATSGPNSRTTQVFINLADNERLDGSGFAPFGRVVEGMDVVDQIYAGYGDGPPRGEGPDQTKIETQGNSYLESHFPRLDFIRQAKIADAH
jgi:peptidyl-prolyl cis-trans isomerase A (cyclophilin A)